MKNLTSHTRFARIADPAAAGTTTFLGDVLDSAGFNNVLFVVALGTVTDGASVRLTMLQGNAADGSDAAATAASCVAVDAGGANSGKLLLLEVERPSARYFRLRIERTIANAEIAGVYALQGGADRQPVEQPADVLATHQFVSPSLV